MKPPTAAGYHVEQLEQVRSVCLYVATKLADLRDEWVIIGGLVPSLLIDQRRLEAADRHVGTLDLDLGLQLGILEKEGYREITARLREAGFGPDSNEAGNLVRQRWKHSEQGIHQTHDLSSEERSIAIHKVQHRGRKRMGALPGAG